jgi:uncharacterized protein (DUF433 family)
MNDSRPVALPDGSVVHSDPEILSGTPVFVGTRVPVKTLVEYLQGGYGVDEFLDNFRACAASRSTPSSRRPRSTLRREGSPTR